MNQEGDRVAVRGYGIAVVEHADNDQVQAVLGGRSVLTVEREKIEQNGRWDADPDIPILIAAKSEYAKLQ